MQTQREMAKPQSRGFHPRPALLAATLLLCACALARAEEGRARTVRLLREKGPEPYVLFQRGQFSPETSPVVGTVLLCLTPAMVGLGVSYICARGFYARHNTVTPVVVGIASIVACAALGYPASRAYGVLGLAGVTSLTTVLNAGLLLVFLRREMGRIDGGRILASAARLAPASLALGLICVLGSAALADALGTTGELAKLLTVLVPLSLGGVAFLAVSAALKTQELTSAWRMARTR